MHRQVQSPRAVVMVRPAHFHVTDETADNVFQASDHRLPSADLLQRTRAEFDAVVDALESAGVTVHVFEDRPDVVTPDSVFPNNWFSTHHGGRVAIYPMYAPGRRLERRLDIIEMLKQNYRVQEVIDYSGLEPDGLFLEGTGAMVFDHIERVAYVAQSRRANEVILERFCTSFGYEPMAFSTRDPQGHSVYHTNVIMGIGNDLALLCTEVIENAARREEIRQRLIASGRTLVELSWSQICEFAGNALEVIGSDGPVLAMSGRARRSLTDEQVATIERSATIIAVDIPTIELSGGSMRCMLAGVHLSPR